MYLDVLEGPHTVRYAARIGDFKPLHSSAVGKALLGALGDAGPLPRMTRHLDRHAAALVAARQTLEAAE